MGHYSDRCAAYCIFQISGQENENRNGKITWLQAFRGCGELFNDKHLVSLSVLQLLKFDITFLHSSPLSYLLYFTENGIFLIPN